MRLGLSWLKDFEYTCVFRTCGIAKSSLTLLSLPNEMFTKTHSLPFEKFQRDVQIHDIGGLEDFA